LSPGYEEATVMNEKRLTKAQRRWLVRLREWSQSGETLSGYAKRRGLITQTLYTAKGRMVAQGLWPESARAEARPAEFVRINVGAREPAPSQCQVHFPNGTRVEIAVPSSGLESVLRAVAAL
jgi:hypothetical protein